MRPPGPGRGDRGEVDAELLRDLPHQRRRLSTAPTREPPATPRARLVTLCHLAPSGVGSVDRLTRLADHDQPGPHRSDLTSGTAIRRTVPA